MTGKKFDVICEQFGVLETKSRIRYPKQIKFSPEFLQALETEFSRHTISEGEGSPEPIRDCASKILKALRFHVAEIANKPKPIQEVKSTQPVKR